MGMVGGSHGSISIGNITHIISTTITTVVEDTILTTTTTTIMEAIMVGGIGTIIPGGIIRIPATLIIITVKQEARIPTTTIITPSRMTIMVTVTPALLKRMVTAARVATTRILQKGKVTSTNSTSALERRGILEVVTTILLNSSSHPITASSITVVEAGMSLLLTSYLLKIKFLHILTSFIHRMIIRICRMDRSSVRPPTSCFPNCRSRLPLLLLMLANPRLPSLLIHKESGPMIQTQWKRIVFRHLRWLLVQEAFRIIKGTPIILLRRKGIANQKLFSSVRVYFFKVLKVNFHIIHMILSHTVHTAHFLSPNLLKLILLW